MSDPDFDRLKAAPVPEPSGDARDRAFSAAMDAFGEARAKKFGPLKGTAAVRRPTSASPSFRGPWRTIMQNRIAIGGAAACLVAVPLAAILVAENGFRPAGLGQEPGRLAQHAEPRQTSAPETRRQAPVEAPRVDQRDADAAKPARDMEVSPKTETFSAPLAPPPATLEAKRSPDAAIASRPLARERQSAQGLGAAGGYAPPSPIAPPMAEPADRDRFADKPQNAVKIAAQEPVSTFSIDADTASYSWVRRSLGQGRKPAPEQVRVEELINYFPYDYPRPADAAAPFKPTVAVYPTPWNRDTRIVHVGIKGFEGLTVARPKANLVFLIDVSGSMAAADKLPLVKTSLKLLLGKLSADDQVSIVTYAGGVGVALEPTKASDRETISAAIDKLGAGGSTAGAAGTEEAYRLARKNFDPNGLNRVMLATDGDFNVGISDDDGLTRLVERERKSGVFLSVLGFGQGNYNDAMMQRLAQNGNGTAAYIDQLDEAQKVLVEEATQTLFPIAKDVKIQVEFNPASVSEYRLIGYETRLLAREDFKDDRVDAGEIGSGATATALYEIVPVGSPARLTEDLRYGAPQTPAPAVSDAKMSGEYGFLRLRYKLPNEDASRLIEQPIAKAGELASVSGASDDVRFAAAVAAFGQKLKGARYVSGLTYDQIAELAASAKGEDRWGYRAGFVRLVGLAKAIARE